MNKTKFIGSIMLLACTIIWGCAFSFQSMASKHLEPFSLCGVRFLIAALVLTPFTVFHLRKENKKNIIHGMLAGLITGTFLGVASIFQQFGIERTTAGKAGFLTAMYIIFVPVISVLVLRKKPTIIQLIGIVVTVIGVGLLSLDSNLRMNLGDFLCLICGLLFAFQIMCVDHFSKKYDSMMLSTMSFYTCAIISLVFSFIFEDMTQDNIKSAIWPIIYLAIFSSCVAYSFQILGQKRLSGVPASLIMSLEAVFSAIFAWILLKEGMNFKEISGAILMMIGVIVVQLFEVKTNKEDTTPSS